MRTLFLIGLLAFLLMSAIAIVLFSERPWLPQGDVVQPIPFSHLVHARCDGCHSSNWREIQPVTRPWSDRAKSPLEIRWNRVYVLPCFVRFSHRIHIHEKIACQTCHGPVQTMNRVTPVKVMNMGFCIGCHQRRHAPRECFVCHY